MRALLKEAASKLGLSQNALYWLARRGQIPHLRVGNRYLFDIDQAEAFLKQKAMENVTKKQDETKQYGILRRVNV